MNSKKQTIRVFRCPHCNYTGYRAVNNEEDDSTCNICSNVIEPSLETKHVTTVEDARITVQRMVLMTQRSRSKSRHGLGVKKRVLNMVSDLSDLNRGRGVSRRRILDECQEVNIDLDKAERFLSQLEEEGQIIVIGDQLKVVQEI